MVHAFVNIVAPIALKDVAHLREQIGRLLDNPANDAARSGFGIMDGEDGIHFASLHALLGSDAKLGYLFLEFSADGDGDTAINRIAASAEQCLEPIFSAAVDWTYGNDLADYLRRHRVRTGFGLFDHAGVDHCGTPGMTVGRIRREADLRRHAEKLFAELPVSLRPVEQVRAVRAQLVRDPKWSWAAALPEPVSRKDTVLVTGLKRTAMVAIAVARTFLWPLLIPSILWAIFVATQQSGWHAIVTAAGVTMAKGLGMSLMLALTALGLLYWRLRANEENDWISDRVISRAELAEILKRENFQTQNHMISHTVLKAGFARRCLVKLGLFAIGTLTPLNGRPGFLDKIGTIHFARWVTLPGTRDYVFVSNYDGSWESYLEDFITKAHEGLTAAWSSSIGFPKTKNLFQKGATDGERFKRFARHSMIHTAFWYSAYPDISTDQIRANANIRRAIALAETDEEASALLSLFGSAVRPIEKIETNQIQSIVFGGLGNMPSGQCLLIDLSGDRTRAKAWLADLQGHIAFSDGRNISKPWVISVAFGPQGLGKLGLPGHAINSFPAAFLDGMTAPGRDRILGDPDFEGRKAQWWWGQEPPDVALLVYAKTQEELGRALTEIRKATSRHEQRIVHEIPLKDVPKKDQDRTEPFGFVDGISQPLIKGTYRATRDPDRLNLVEPGEFILGYPDNHGNLPPIPHMTARRDPEGSLPIGQGVWDFDAAIDSTDREFGRNGSYLVIRQLEQHVTAFWDFCSRAAKDVASYQSPGYKMDKVHIAAKMVGRWPDGSPLVRWPYESETSYRLDAGDVDPERLRRLAEAKQIKINPANDFRLGAEDPQAIRCPFGSHIRRTNPRESQLPGEDEQVDISNRHRILRLGRQYLPDPKKKQDPGILFMCLNGDIERQFEFIQQTWANSAHFHGLDGEADPLTSPNGLGSHYTIPTRGGPIRLTDLPKFVTTRGGGYFFLPGRKLIDYLARS